MEEVTTRVCCRCKVELPATLEYFSWRKARNAFGSFCKKCGAARVREARAADPEHAKAVRTAWLERNPNYDRDRARRERATNPQGPRDRIKRSYYKNQEKRLESRRAYRIAHLDKEKEYDREWRINNPEKYSRKLIAKKQRSGEARAVAAGVLVEKVDYFAVLERDKEVCHICGRQITEGWLSFDHIIPLSKGGPHTFENVALAHYECNRTKNNSVRQPEGKE